MAFWLIILTFYLIILNFILIIFIYNGNNHSLSLIFILFSSLTSGNELPSVCLPLSLLLIVYLLISAPHVSNLRPNKVKIITPTLVKKY